MNKSQKHIVIIEDDPVLRELTQMVCVMEGFEVDMFEDGEKGIEYFEKNLASVDLVLLDLFMPVLDGGHVLNWLRKTCQSSVSVVVMTAMVDEETERHMLSAGANKVIKKPLDMKILLTTIQALLNK